MSISVHHRQDGLDHFHKVISSIYKFQQVSGVTNPYLHWYVKTHFQFQGVEVTAGVIFRRNLHDGAVISSAFSRRRRPTLIEGAAPTLTEGDSPLPTIPPPRP